MTLFERLKNGSASEWSSYVDHDFVVQLGRGDLPKSCFQHYLVQDYLFLIQFARAYALAVYKSPSISDMRMAQEGVKAILDVELDLHVELCAPWGMSRHDIESADEDLPTMAYTRFVLETGMAGDLLDLQAALAPCVIGYAEIGATLTSQQAGLNPKNPYARWIEEYAGEGYQELATGFAGWMDRTAEVYLTDSRFPRLLNIFRKAAMLEADFWQMGLNADK